MFIALQKSIIRWPQTWTNGTGGGHAIEEALFYCLQDKWAHVDWYFNIIVISRGEMACCWLPLLFCHGGDNTDNQNYRSSSEEVAPRAGGTTTLHPLCHTSQPRYLIGKELTHKLVADMMRWRFVSSTIWHIVIIIKLIKAVCGLSK